MRLLWEQTVLPGLVKQANLDLLHSLHYTRPYQLPCASVVTFHDMTFFLFPDLHTRTKQFFFPTAIRISARRANAIVAVSESTRQDTIRLMGISPQKIYTTQLGVDKIFRPISDPNQLQIVRQKYQLPEEFILFVGLVEPRKNVSLLVRAFKNLVDKGVRIPLVIAGKFGWGYDEVLRTVESLGLKDRVHFPGYIAQQDLPLVYNQASLFVYPTLYEGFGLPALEAMACGVPIVTTAISSLPEIVGEAGVLVPPDNLEALSQAMSIVLTDLSLREHLAEVGPERAAQFTWNRTAQETLQVYKQVLKVG